MSNLDYVAGVGICLAQISDPVTTWEKFGYPGLMILFLVALWMDNKRIERQNRADQAKRDEAEDARAKALNGTLTELNRLIGRLIEKTEEKE